MSNIVEKEGDICFFKDKKNPSLVWIPFLREKRERRTKRKSDRTLSLQYLHFDGLLASLPKAKESKAGSGYFQDP